MKALNLRVVVLLSKSLRKPESPELLQDSPVHLDGALNAEYRHQLLAPPGQPPINDARLLGWETYVGLGPRKVRPPVDGAPHLGPGGLIRRPQQP